MTPNKLDRKHKLVGRDDDVVFAGVFTKQARSLTSDDVSVSGAPQCFVDNGVFYLYPKIAIGCCDFVNISINCSALL